MVSTNSSESVLSEFIAGILTFFCRDRKEDEELSARQSPDPGQVRVARILARAI